MVMVVIEEVVVVGLILDEEEMGLILEEQVVDTVDTVDTVDMVDTLGLILEE